MFSTTVLIVAIVMFASVCKAKFNRDAASGVGRDDGTTRAETQALHAEVRALKQRIATLERIATDGSNALDREIEALRDRP
jgi:hypothetical protein